MPKGVYNHYKIKGHKVYGGFKKGNTYRFKKGYKPSVNIHKFIKGHKINVGRKNNYKGGITPKNQLIRNGIELKLWRKSVFERDNYICQKTKISGGYLVAHHINNFSEFPELRTSIENGITLSRKAHIEFHKSYGFRNNTKEQLLDFLNDK